METKLDCAIVRDLLPSYADALTSEVTNQAVQAHLDGCPECTKLLQTMKEPTPTETEAPQVEYLKKVHRRAGLRGLLIGVSLLLIGILLLGFRLFYVGSKAQSRELLCTASVSDRTVTVSGEFLSSGVGVARVTFTESAGMVHATIYTAPKVFFNSGSINATYTANGEVDRVQVNEIVLWEEGTKIDSMTAQLFAAVNPFVGDMSANSRIAELLGVNRQLGEFSNELLTDLEPYGWVIRLQQPLNSGSVQTDSATDDTSVIQFGIGRLQLQMKFIRDASAVMLATIKNLGYVTWQYELDGMPSEYTLTAEKATNMFGADIKSFSDTAAQLQTLLQRIGME